MTNLFQKKIKLALEGFHWEVQLLCHHSSSRDGRCISSLEILQPKIWIFRKKYIAEKSQKISFGFGKSPKTFYLCSALERHPCTLWANRIVLWCNGSTAVFGSACLGSNPGKTTFLVAKSLKNQRFSGFSFANFVSCRTPHCLAWWCTTWDEKLFLLVPMSFLYRTF